MYEIESCGPATDYICLKQTDVTSKDTGKRCIARVNLPVGAAIGACSEANGVESCYCDSDGWVDTIDYFINTQTRILRHILGVTIREKYPETCFYSFLL